jgi:endonuclease/exonuclease/phosphatase (EEP) superfamily protein YafD
LIDKANTSAAAAGGDAAPPKKRKSPGRLECELGLGLGIIGLIASRLGHLWIAFDVFSQFTLQFAVVAAGFLIGRFMPRARLITAFVLIAGGLLAIGAWPHIATSHVRVLDEAKPGERALKVATFNSWYDNPQIDAVKAEIERIDADIVTLVEFGPQHRQIIKDLGGRYPHHVECFAVDYCHMAILSKLPILSGEGKTGWKGPPLISAQLGPEAGNLLVFGVHTIRFPHSRAQFNQIAGLVELLSATPGRKLVMGDFNATPFSRIVQTIEKNLGLVRLSGLPTWPSRLQLPQVAIDHIFVSPDIRQLESQQIGEPAGSDHYPVLLKIAVPLQ